MNPNKVLIEIFQAGQTNTPIQLSGELNKDIYWLGQHNKDLPEDKILHTIQQYRNFLSKKSGKVIRLLLGHGTETFHLRFGTFNYDPKQADTYLAHITPKSTDEDKIWDILYRKAIASGMSKHF